MQYNISLLVGLKNNLSYNKYFYITTRKLYPEVEICFVSYGSTDGTHEWLDSLSDPNLKYYYSVEQKTFSDTFNKAAKIATKEYVMYLHNDIVLAPNFLENIQKHLQVDRVVSYTTIEPPIFAGHERPGKIIHDLGKSLETFDIKELYKYVENKQTEDLNRLEKGITFFMCLSRELLLAIGGMDNLFNPMFCEDDDLIRRLSIKGLELVTSLDAICYHFVSKTSRFSEEYAIKTQQIEHNSNKNFIRKWGSKNVSPKYNIAYIVKNANMQVVEALEPWCDRLYIDDDMHVIIDSYREKEQSNTDFDLTKRVLTIEYNDPKAENDIVIEFDAKDLNQESFAVLQQFPQIIEQSGDIGEMELHPFKLSIFSMNTYEKDMIQPIKKY
jgi:GT2 family glycosyltransferase